MNQPATCDGVIHNVHRVFCKAVGLREYICLTFVCSCGHEYAVSDTSAKVNAIASTLLEFSSDTRRNLK